MVALGSVWFSQYSGRAPFIEGNLIVKIFEPLRNLSSTVWSALQRLQSSSCSGDRRMTLQSGRQPSRSSKYLCSRNQRAAILKLPYSVGILIVFCADTTVRFCSLAGLPIHVRSLLEPTSQAVNETEHVLFGLHSACVGTISRIRQNARKVTEEIVPCGHQCSRP